MKTIGFLELNSIAKGIEVADAMIKAAECELVFAKSGCPGKYCVLITGDVGAVKSSIEVGESVGERFVVDKLIIPSVHPQVIKTINMVNECAELNAIGVLEYFSITASIVGADTAVKASTVSLLDIRLGTGIGGKSYVVLTGDVSAVTEAVEAGAKKSIESGMLINKVVIPNPRPEIFDALI